MARYLMAQGHVILERNRHCGHLEIDIVSLASDGIHFVEVKTRRYSVQAPPQENVGFVKQHRMAAAALNYLSSARGRNYGDMECHLDVAAVLYSEDGTTLSISYLPDAVLPIFW